MDAHGAIIVDADALVWAASDTPEGATQAARAKLKRAGRNPDEVSTLRMLPATEMLLSSLALGNASIHWVMSGNIACTPNEYRREAFEANRTQLLRE